MFRLRWVFILLILGIVFKANPVSSAGPALIIVSPEEGALIEGYIVEVKFEVKNFTLRDHRASASPVSGQGYLHFWLDSGSSNQSPARKWSRDLPYSFADVPPGEHLLVVELVGNDGQSLEPRVMKTVKFKTSAGGINTSDGSGSGEGSLRSASVNESTKIPTTERQETYSPIELSLIIGFFAFVLGIVGFINLRRG